MGKPRYSCAVCSMELDPDDWCKYCGNGPCHPCDRQCRYEQRADYEQEKDRRIGEAIDSMEDWGR